MYSKENETGTKIVSLYTLVEEMLNNYRKQRADHRLFVINEVPRTISITASKSCLAGLLDKFAAVISSNPGKNCLRVSVNPQDKQIGVSVKPVMIEGFRFSGIRGLRGKDVRR